MLYYIAKFILYLLFKILFRLQSFGKNNFPQKGGFIIASNHLSFLDPIAVGLVSFRKVKFLARDDLFNNKAFAFLLKSLGAIPIKKGGAANIKPLKKALQILGEKHGIVIFPEGTRSQSGELQKMYNGIGFLAIKSNCPVIPVLIVGTDKVLPIKAKFARLRKIMVYVGHPIVPLQINDKSESFKAFSCRVEESIKDLKIRITK